MDKVPLKTPAEVEAMREPCRLTARILDALEDFVVPGISTDDINSFVHNMTVNNGAAPSPLHYKGYPKSVCTSINDVICHGIPSPFVVLKAGDIINIDVTCFKNGFHGDASGMYFVGGEEACSPESRKLVYATREAMYAAIEVVAPGAHVGDIGAAIQGHLKKLGLDYGIVREYTGHGIGRDFHEPPQVLHIGRPGTGIELCPGMTFTIEPMINAGTAKTVLSKVDGWTVRTADGELSAQWEHTVLVTESGCDILTRREREPQG